jgi:hypothetical protein
VLDFSAVRSERRGAPRGGSRRVERFLIAAALLGSAVQARALEGWVAYRRAPGGRGIYQRGDLRVERLGGQAVTVDSEVYYAQLSPVDASRVVYSRYRSGKAELVVADRDGSNKRVLKGGFTDIGVSQAPWPCWRRADSFVYSADAPTAYVMDVATGAESVFYSTSQKVRGPSVDVGRKRMVFFGSATRVTTVDLAAGPGSETGYGGCGWWISPDGSKFTKNHGSHDVMDVHDFDGSIYRTFDAPSGRYWNRQRWSNNSDRWIIYPLGPSTQLTEWSQVWLKDIDTGDEVQVTSHTSYNDVPLDLWVGTDAAPVLSFDPASLAFAADEAGPDPAPLDVDVTNSGSGALDPVATSTSYDSGSGWLAVSRSGSGDAQVLTNSVSVSGLPAGSYSATVEIACPNAGNSPQSYGVTLAVRATASPVLSLGPTGLTLTAEESGPDPSPQVVAVTNSGSGTLDAVSTTVSYESGSGWLAVARSGSGNGQTLSNSVDVAGLAAGLYTATVEVACANASNSPAAYSVSLTIVGAESIEVARPSSGDVWYVGTTPRIEWTARNVEDVAISYRTDPGAYWVAIADTVDTTSPHWGSYPWPVPDAPSTECQVLVAGYFGEAPTESGVFEIRSLTDADSDGMDDGWETLHFGDLSHDGTADTDGDGLTDLEEFMRATDPAEALGARELGFSCAGEGVVAGAGPLLPALLGLALLLRRASPRQSSPADSSRRRPSGHGAQAAGRARATPRRRRAGKPSL